MGRSYQQMLRACNTEEPVLKTITHLRPAGPETPELVSVIVPVFNGARYLEASLDSLLRQTYPKIEILVLDDASTDETPSIIASYGEQVRSFRQAENLGIYANANAGIADAAGEFVAVYHADDVYDPRIVEREVEFLNAHPEAGAVFCLDILVDQDDREYARLGLPQDLQGHELLTYGDVINGFLRYKNRFLRCPGAMVRARLHREVGLYRQERFRNTSDLDMWLRIARHCPIGLLEEHLFRYRHFHGNSSQRYQYLRTTPENFFGIMDLYLAEDARPLARPDALEAYEAHREEDRLRLAVSQYIRGDLGQARKGLADIRTARICRGWTVQRTRLLLLLFAFRVLTRLPRSEAVAGFFLRRWFEKRAPRAHRARRAAST